MEESGIIEPIPDEDLPDADQEVTSDYEPSLNGSTFGSLTSSVTDHVWEYGRRYHIFRYGRYPIPNDEDEFKRESLKHSMFKELLSGRLYFAPIGDNPQKIIDLGTGFGEWAIEVGEMFPSAKVTGIDLSPIQPVWIPPNVEFLVDDIEDQWMHDNDYDFMHLRFVGITIKDNIALFRTIFENLKPGGWVESQEILPRVGCDDNTTPLDYPLSTFYRICKDIMHEKYQFEIGFVEHLPQDLEQIGFVNVQRRIYHLPVGEWPRDRHLRMVGGYFREVLMDFVNAMVARPFVEAGLEKTEIEDLVNNIKAAMGNRRIHAYLPIHFVWAQKPPA
ncbi:S-adenosyl-L-methionine-dependent methyltransferase [Diplogelasinospora grovesii]|uniref:S-adenosyl-L-methionine-dependent methyltransferase n=1 Tax=Diplogelasinospora grovesii TaxID=303347 RepID=A0AAN6NGV4_9PEZI|nr:S-adenosyl-L-methionine-dependent methyltransferase [Diplogelasinospora grovesii]